MMKFLKGTLFCLLLSVGLLFLIQLASLIVYLAISIKNEESEVKSVGGTRYLITQINENTKKVQVGFTELVKELSSDDDFVSYQNEQGDHFLITNFEANRYECTGTCVCEEDVNFSSRRNTLSVTRPIMYLVAAASSLIAVELANKRFERECEESFSEDSTCEGQVSSEVAVCSMINDEAERARAHANIYMEGLTVRRKFECHGKCVEMQYYDGTKTKIENKYYDSWKTLNAAIPNRDAERIQRDAEDYGCDRLELTDSFEMDYTGAMFEEVENNPIIKRSYYLAASRMFMNIHLNPFCTENSLKIVRKSVEGCFNADKIPLCAGHLRTINTSVKCIDKGGVDIEESDE